MPNIIEVPTAPVNGTNEVQQIAETGTITAGRYKLAYKYDVTDWIAWDAVANTVRDRLRALNQVQATGVTSVTGGPIADASFVINFGGHLAAADVAALTVAANELVGGSIAITTTTPGVNATRRGSPTGTVLVAEDTGVLYVNTGTPQAPVWKRLLAGQGAAIVDLTAAVGTANDTVQDVTGAFDQTILNNNFKDLATKINAILVAMRAAGSIVP